MKHKRDVMSEDKYNEMLRRVEAALERSKNTHWNHHVVSATYPPVVKQRFSRPCSFSVLEHARLLDEAECLTLEQRLTSEDRAFLADLKVGL